MLFAADIQKAMAAAGFDVQIQSSILAPHFPSGPVVGIIISGPKDHIIRVGTAFTQAGFNVRRAKKGREIYRFLSALNHRPHLDNFASPEFLPAFWRKRHAQ